MTETEKLRLPSAREPSARERTIRATVSRGNTIVVDDPDPEHRIMLGWRANERGDPTPYFGSARIEYGPHKEVDLPESEVRRLRAIGALIDPDKIIPALEQTEGPTITEQSTGAKVQGPNYGPMR